MSKKKRVGIITYHRAINYGAVLQAYALQESIKDLGADPYIIDYRNNKLEQHHKVMKLLDCKTIKQFIVYFLQSKNYNNKYKKFRGFLGENLQTTSPYFSIRDLDNVEEEFDLFITGSDQVWNYKINEMDPAYFLSFIKNNFKKNTYAASFGVNDIPSNLEDQYYNLLKDFNSYAIREIQGASIINKLLNKNSNVVLDPTLLISKDKWFEVANDQKMEFDQYILIYAFGGSIYINDFAKRLSEQTGYKIVAISNTYKKSPYVTYIKSAGPEQFLSLFKNAKYILTNSFHGTVFSINFNKQFFTEFLPNTVGTNSRMEDVLDMFELRDRQLLSSDIALIENNIDYSKVNDILEKEREKSIFILKEIIQ